MIYPTYEKLQDAIKVFEAHGVPLEEGQHAWTQDGHFIYKNGKWEIYENEISE